MEPMGRAGVPWGWPRVFEGGSPRALGYSPQRPPGGQGRMELQSPTGPARPSSVTFTGTFAPEIWGTDGLD